MGRNQMLGQPFKTLQEKSLHSINDKHWVQEELFYFYFNCY